MSMDTRGEYKPYPAYKDSGVEWLTEIPEHWRISSFKYIADYQNSYPFKPEDWGAVSLVEERRGPYFKDKSIVYSLPFITNVIDSLFCLRIYVFPRSNSLWWFGHKINILSAVSGP